jgi:pimeloyl-ACP methyl ester carboxylesterase
MLATGRAFTTFDFRAHGASPGEMRDLTLTGLLDDLARVLESHGDRYARTVLVGSSMGGCTAAWWAARHPGRIHRCVLVAPAFRFPSSLAQDLGEERMAAWKRDGVLQWDAGFTTVPLGWGLMEDAATYDVEELRRTYATPTLIVHGMKDDSVPWRDSAEFMERCPFKGIELLLLADGDHRLSDHRHRLATEVARFFE